MTYRQLREKLLAAGRGEALDAFEFLADLSALTSLADDEDQLQQAREILVRLLEYPELFENYKSVVQTLLRRVGLFPYVEHAEMGVAVQIAAETHRPVSMPSGIVFTTKQAEVYRELMAGRNVILSAPTSAVRSK